MTVIIYRKDHRRRPIHLGKRQFIRDIQADIPAGWCTLCGCEVFRQGEDRCIWCQKRKENPYE